MKKRSTNITHTSEFRDTAISGIDKNKKIIFTEGKQDRYFYSNFDELVRDFQVHPTDTEHLGSKNKVIEKTLESPYFFSIVDSDYEGVHNCSRVWCINYYCIENIILVHSTFDFNHLKSEIISFFKNHTENAKYCNLSFSHVCDLSTKKDIFIADSESIHDKIHPQYYSYVENYITCENTYLRFGNFKNSIINFHKHNCGYKRNRNFIINQFEFEHDFFGNIENIFEPTIVNLIRSQSRTN